MARRTSRRKPRVVWLPPDATLRTGHNPAVNQAQTGTFQFVMSPAAPIAIGDPFTVVVPVVGDVQSPEFQSGGLGTTSLSDIYNSGYRLRRIVGKIFCAMSQTSTGGPDASGIMVTAGFIILRTDVAGIPLQAATPNSYSPAVIGGWPDPWIWMRSWRLSNFTSALTVGGKVAYPETNVENGPAACDGPNVDQKTARIIGLEERLFLVITTTAMIGGTAAYNLTVEGHLRVLGSMRSNVGNRRNASR